MSIVSQGFSQGSIVVKYVNEIKGREFKNKIDKFMKSDEEIKESFKLFLDENGIINLIFLKAETKPEVSVRLAELVEEALLKILKKNPKKIYNSLVDFLTLGEKISYVSKEAREVYFRAMFHKQVRNIAMVGSNIYYKVVVNLILQLTNKGKTLNGFPVRKRR